MIARQVAREVDRGRILYALGYHDRSIVIATGDPDQPNEVKKEADTRRNFELGAREFIRVMASSRC
jgi:hypothetical protein